MNKKKKKRIQIPIQIRFPVLLTKIFCQYIYSSNLAPYQQKLSLNPIGSLKNDKSALNDLIQTETVTLMFLPSCYSIPIFFFFAK